MKISSTFRHDNCGIRMARVNVFEGLEKSSYGNLTSRPETGCNTDGMYLDMQVSVPHSFIIQWKHAYSKIITFCMN